MPWANIIADPEFLAETDEVKQRVATNYFNKKIASDPEFKKESQEVQDRVLSNFLGTVPVTPVEPEPDRNFFEKAIDKFREPAVPGLEDVEPLSAEPTPFAGITSGQAPVPDTTSPLRQAVGGIPDVLEGVGKAGFEMAKFLPAFAAGATELLPQADERLPGPFSQREAGPAQPAEATTFSKKLVQAQGRFEKVMGLGSFPASAEAGQQVMEAISMPFARLEDLALPQIKRVMVAAGFEGDARELDEGARFIFSGALIAGTAGVAKGVKGAAKGRTPKVRGEIPAETIARDARITALEERAGIKEAKVTPEPVTPKAPALKVKVAEKPAKPAVTPKPEKTRVLEAKVVKAKGEHAAHKAGKRRITLVRKAEKIEAQVKDVIKEITKREGRPPSPARKELEGFRARKRLPGFIEETLGSEAGAINLERLAGEISGKSKVAKEVVRKRGGDINVMKLESAKFINDLKFGGRKLSETPGIRAKIESKLAKKGQRDRFTAAEEEAITLLAEKMKDPTVLKNIGKEKVIDIVKNPTPEILSAVVKVRKYFDEGFKFIQENPGGEGLPYRENYVNRIWDIPKNKNTGANAGFRVDNPFTKKRTIPSIQEGIEQGLVPKTLKITELIEIYDGYRIETHANRTLVDTLGELKVFDEATGKLEPLVMRADVAPEGWITIDHPALNRSKFIGKLPEGKGIILTKVPLKVHPEVAPWLKNIFGKQLGADLPARAQQAINATTVLNAFAKKGQLSLSLFHGNALMESMASSGQLLKSWGVLSPLKAYRALRFGDFEVFKNMELAKDAIRNGDVQIGALSDVQKGIVDNALKGLEHHTRKVPGVSHLTSGLRQGNKLWDAGLWDYVHNTFKLLAYEGQIASEIGGAMKSVAQGKRKPLTQAEILKIKQDTGNFVNNSFGGQNWDLAPILGHPSMRQLAQLTFLSPDWTVSTLKQAGALPAGFLKAVAGGNKTQLKRAGFFWARSVLYFNLIAQTVNYQNTKKEYGEGRFTWNNAPGKHLDIFIGRNDDGTERYLRTGKQFREVMEWGEDPIGKAGAKLSPVLREGLRQVTRHDPGSGFPAEFADDEIWSPESLKKRGISFISLPVPFSLRSYVSNRTANFMFTWPTSKGMSNFGARKLFEKAIRKAEKTGDTKQIQRVYLSALENNLDAQGLFDRTRASLKADVTYDNKTIARKLLIDYKQMKNDKQREDLVTTYRKRGVLTGDVMIQFSKLLKAEGKVKKQQRVIKLIRKKGK